MLGMNGPLFGALWDKIVSMAKCISPAFFDNAGNMTATGTALGFDFTIRVNPAALLSGAIDLSLLFQIRTPLGTISSGVKVTKFKPLQSKTGDPIPV